MAATIVAVSAGGVAVSDWNENPAVKALHMVMSLYAHHLGQLGAMAKGEVEYDAAAATAAAGNLAKLTQLNQMSMWPVGTDADSIKGTRAKAEIWSNFPDVAAQGQALADASLAIETAAGESLQSLQAAMGAVGGACGACHKPYRTPEN